jgi:hypothetical protein
MESMESTCRNNDRHITSCIWLLMLLVCWMIAADRMAPAITYEYDETGTKGLVHQVKDGDPSKRTLSRVLRTMTDNCKSGIVLGPQVRVRGKPFMYRVMRICERKLNFVNPYVAVQGTSSGYCLDEYAGENRRVQRTFPIAVHSRDMGPVTFMELDEVCPVTAALDVLDSKW